jgi:ankyrin repeat protein
VYCQLDTLRRCLPNAIRQALDELPESLDETYKRTLLGIEKEKRRFAHRLFQCLTVAVRPLRVDELAELLAIRFDSGQIPRYHADWQSEDTQEAVLSACSSLIAVVNVDGPPVVQFSHFSVKEFLTSDRLANSTEDFSGYHVLPHVAHTILAQASLGVLLHLGDNVDKHTIKKFPFAQYAAQHWVDHGQFENVSSSIEGAMERLFDMDESSFATWIWIYDIDYPFRHHMFEDHPPRPEALPLYYATRCGFRNLVEHLITKHPDDIDARGGNHGSAVNAALVKRNMDIVLLLLEHGAHMNIKDARGDTPLFVASRNGRRDNVVLLLEHHADVNLANDGTGLTPLMGAAQRGELEIVRILLHHGANVDSLFKSGQTPLNNASQCGYLDIVRLLVQSGAALDTSDRDGWTPLFTASRNGHPDIVQSLIQNGAAVDLPNNEARTPLMTASDHGHLDIVRLLIQSGAAVDSRDHDGWTPLMYASRFGHLDVLQFLVQNGAAIDSHDHQGETSLMVASRYGYIHIVQELIDHGAAINALRTDLSTPLHLASAEGHLAVVELLIEHHADVDERDEDQKTPLDRATAYGRLDIARFLLKSGSNSNSQDSHGSTPLHTATYNGHLDMVKLLLESGADVNIRNSTHYTPLDVATASGNREVTRYLANHMGVKDPWDGMAVTPIDMDADNLVLHTTLASVVIAEQANIPGGLDKTSLYDASARGDVEVVQLLLDQGADVNQRNARHITALHAASTLGKLEVAKLLVESGADVNCREKEGWTPLLHASRLGLRDLAELLLDNGADVSAKTQDLHTPLHFASWYHHPEVVSLLLGRGADVHVRDIDGRTPSGLASRVGARDIVQLLLDKAEVVRSPFVSSRLSPPCAVNPFSLSTVTPRRVNLRGLRPMMETYPALGWQWMRTSLAMVDYYRVMLGVIRWTAERRVDGCHNV